LDPKSGAQDLQTFSWVSYGLGSIFAAQIGGYVVQYYKGKSRYAFFLYAIIIMFSMIFAYNMSIDQEAKQGEQNQVQNNEEGQSN